jgi:integrase
VKFTQANVAKFKLPEGKLDHIEFDDSMPGFGLRVRNGGEQEHRTYILQYKIGPKQRRMTLGSVAKISLADAQKTARKLFGAIAEGKDPANEKAVARTQASHTFAVIVSDFLQVQQAKLKPRSFIETQRFLQKHLRPLHRLSLASISRATVAAQLRMIAKEHGPVSADRARAALSKFFSWAMGEGLAQANPVIGTNKAAGESKARDRVLTDEELATVWIGAPENDYGRIVRLLILTACRRDEIGSLRWSEIDKETRIIVLPSDRTKNSRTHHVPLSKIALDIIESIPRRVSRDFVFGEGKGGFSGWSKAKAALDAQLGLKPWRLHDLRRTACTRMADAGVEPHIIEAVINHVSGHKAGVAGVYNRSTYENEKRAALDALGHYVMSRWRRRKAEMSNTSDAPRLGA